MDTRTDRLTAVQVDLAINIAATHGTAAGARALRDLCRPIELALRVLLRPDRRRLGDNLHLVIDHAHYQLGTARGDDMELHQGLAFSAWQASNRSRTR